MHSGDQSNFYCHEEIEDTLDATLIGNRHNSSSEFLSMHQLDLAIANSSATILKRLSYVHIHTDSSRWFIF